jgi:hypothetical protein
MCIYPWRARRFTFQIGNRAHGHEADIKVSVARTVSIKASAHETALLYVPAFAFAPRGACSFLHTHTQLYLRRRTRRRGKKSRRNTPTHISQQQAHLSGLFAKRFMISDSDMAAEQYKFYDYAREAANQAEAAPVLMMRRFRLISRRRGLDFAVKCPQFENMQLFWCCASAGVSSALEKSMAKGNF